MAGDQRPGRGHADEDGAGPGADAGAGFLAQRGVGLVADHDRVGVGDFLVVADEPLVGLDRDRAVGVVAAVEQRRPQALLVAAVGDLADELVDQVAAVGEDQDAAGLGRLDEADRGDRLAGAGRVLEPEAAGGAGVLGGLLDHLLVLVDGRFLPVLRLLVGGELLVLLVLVLLVVSSSSASARRRRRLGARLRRPSASSSTSPSASAAPSRRSSSVITCCWAISSASVPERASTWCGFSSAPSRSFGGSSARKRSSPSSSEKSRRHSIEGYSAPASSSLQRRVEGAAARGARAPAPRAPRRRAGRARGRTPPHARYRRLKELPRLAATSLVLAIEGFWVPPPPNTRQTAGASERGCRESVFPSPPEISAAPRTANRTYVL